MHTGDPFPFLTLRTIEMSTLERKGENKKNRDMCLI